AERRRYCIGRALATTEIQCIVATMAQRHRLDLLPGARVTTSAGLTLHPRSAVPMLLPPAPGASSKRPTLQHRSVARLHRARSSRAACTGRAPYALAGR